MSSLIFWKLHFLDPPSHIQQHKQIDIKFRITKSTFMDRKYPNALAYIKIEAVIRVKQKLWAVKFWAKMIWKQPSSFVLFQIQTPNHHQYYWNNIKATINSKYPANNKTISLFLRQQSKGSNLRNTLSLICLSAHPYIPVCPSVCL